MNIKKHLLFFFLLSTSIAMNAQLIPSDTTIMTVNEREITFIKHDGNFSFKHQFEFDDKLIFCSRNGVYERTNEGIIFIAGPDENLFPTMVVEDANYNLGYSTIFGEIGSFNQDYGIILHGGDVSPEYANLEYGIQTHDLISTFAPEFHYLDRLTTSFISDGMDGSYNISSGFRQFGGKNYNIIAKDYSSGATSSYSSRVTTSNNTIINIPLYIIDACVVKDELYFLDFQLHKIVQGNEVIDITLPYGFEFKVRSIGSWNDELIILSDNMLTIGLPEYSIDLSYVLDKVDSYFPDKKLNMKIDSKGHLWFGYNLHNSTAVIEVILDDKILQDFESPPTGNFGRHQVTTDTTETIQQNEKLLIIEHSVHDLVLDQGFSPSHIIDIGEDVFVGSDLGFLRRQQDGLVPVIESSIDNSSYYLSVNSNPESQLFPYTELKLAHTVNGYSMQKYNNGSLDTTYTGLSMLEELMDQGDGRNFYLKDHNKYLEQHHANLHFYEKLESLFGWGKKEGDFVIEQKTSTLPPSFAYTGKDESSISIRYKDNITNQEISDEYWEGNYPVVFAPYYGGITSHYRDVAVISDSLAIFPAEFLVTPIYPISMSGNNLGEYSYYSELPISVDKYKAEPIYLYEDHFDIGFPGNLTTYNLEIVESNNLTQVQVTKDHHIWMFSDDKCYEIIREQDQGLLTDLRPSCFIAESNITFLQSCSETTEALVEINFTDSEDGQGDYNIYLNQELVAEITGTQVFQLPLESIQATQTFEIYIQNQNDLLCKQKIILEVPCLLDQDEDGFTNDVDCDDLNAEINPNAIDIPENGIDEDCNGVDLFNDLDGDGFTSDIDCDDANPEINPEAIDIPYNDIDEDCNGSDLSIDEDQDGFTSDIDCDDSDPEINPGAIEILDNDIDEDCNGSDLSAIHNLQGIKLSVYPNPVLDFVGIELDDTLILEYRIFNLEGKLMISGTLKNGLNHKINMESLSEGMYFLEIKDQDGNGKIIEHLIKI